MRTATPASEFEELDDATAVEVLSIRFRILTGLGLDPEEAAVVAGHPEVRLMDAIGFVRRGYPVRATVQILLGRSADRVHSAP